LPIDVVRPMLTFLASGGGGLDQWPVM